MLTDFTATITQIDEMIVEIAKRMHEHVWPPREHSRVAEFASTLRDLAEARELLEVAQGRTEPARRARRMAEAAMRLAASLDRQQPEEVLG